MAVRESKKGSRVRWWNSARAEGKSRLADFKSKNLEIKTTPQIHVMMMMHEEKECLCKCWLRHSSTLGRHGIAKLYKHCNYMVTAKTVFQHN